MIGKIDILEKKHDLPIEDLANLISENSYEIISCLAKAADRVRNRYVGSKVHLRGIIEFSNYCCNTCLYCGLRGANRNVKRFRMSPMEIISRAREVSKLGVKTIVLQSGEDRFYSTKTLCFVIEKIKAFDVAVTLSIGELGAKDYAALKASGADRFLLRIETTDTKLYENLHPGMSFKNRKMCLWNLKSLGYEVGTGCLIGLPGQTPLMLAKDIKFFKELDSDMIGSGPFIPNSDTPLKSQAGGSMQLALKMIALTRMMLPDINLPVTTALAVKDKEGYKKGLRYGANVIMPNMSINKFKELYKIYPGKGNVDTDIGVRLDRIKRLIIDEGREIGKCKGNRITKKF